MIAINLYEIEIAIFQSISERQRSSNWGQVAAQFPLSTPAIIATATAIFSFFSFKDSVKFRCPTIAYMYRDNKPLHCNKDSAFLSPLLTTSIHKAVYRHYTDVFRVARSQCLVCILSRLSTRRLIPTCHVICLHGNRYRDNWQVASPTT